MTNLSSTPLDLFCLRVDDASDAITDVAQRPAALGQESPEGTMATGSVDTNVDGATATCDEKDDDTNQKTNQNSFGFRSIVDSWIVRPASYLNNILFNDTMPVTYRDLFIKHYQAQRFNEAKVILLSAILSVTEWDDWVAIRSTVITTSASPLGFFNNTNDDPWLFGNDPALTEEVVILLGVALVVMIHYRHQILTKQELNDNQNRQLQFIHALLTHPFGIYQLIIRNLNSIEDHFGIIESSVISLSLVASSSDAECATKCLIPTALDMVGSQDTAMKIYGLLLLSFLLEISSVDHWCIMDEMVLHENAQIRYAICCFLPLLIRHNNRDEYQHRVVENRVTRYLKQLMEDDNPLVRKLCLSVLPNVLSGMRNEAREDIGALFATHINTDHVLDGTIPRLMFVLSNTTFKPLRFPQHHLTTQERPDVEVTKHDMTNVSFKYSILFEMEQLFDLPQFNEVDLRSEEVHNDNSWDSLWIEALDILFKKSCLNLSKEITASSDPDSTSTVDDSHSTLDNIEHLNGTSDSDCLEFKQMIIPRLLARHYSWEKINQAKVSQRSFLDILDTMGSAGPYSFVRDLLSLCQTAEAHSVRHYTLQSSRSMDEAQEEGDTRSSMFSLWHYMGGTTLLPRKVSDRFPYLVNVSINRPNASFTSHIMDVILTRLTCCSTSAQVFIRGIRLMGDLMNASGQESLKFKHSFTTWSEVPDIRREFRQRIIRALNELPLYTAPKLEEIDCSVCEEIDCSEFVALIMRPSTWKTLHQNDEDVNWCHTARRLEVILGELSMSKQTDEDTLQDHFFMHEGNVVAGCDIKQLTMTSSIVVRFQQGSTEEDGPPILSGAELELTKHIGTRLYKAFMLRWVLCGNDSDRPSGYDREVGWNDFFRPNSGGLSASDFYKLLDAFFEDGFEASASMASYYGAKAFHSLTIHESNASRMRDWELLGSYLVASYNFFFGELSVARAFAHLSTYWRVQSTDLLNWRVRIEKTAFLHGIFSMIGSTTIGSTTTGSSMFATFTEWLDRKAYISLTEQVITLSTDVAAFVRAEAFTKLLVPLVTLLACEVTPIPICISSISTSESKATSEQELFLEKFKQVHHGRGKKSWQCALHNDLIEALKHVPKASDIIITKFYEHLIKTD